MKTRIYATLLLLVGLLLPSCHQDSIPEPVVIEIAPSGVITLPREASAQEVSIRTNRDSWHFIKSAEWLEVSQSGSTLLIKASANEATESRSAEIVIVSGDSQEKLLIDQAGASSLISTSVSAIETNQWGGSYTVDVVSNLKDWRVETSESWITVTPIPAMSEIRISIAEHESREGRMGKIYLSDAHGRGLHEITIHQSGTLYYVLPYLGFIDSSEQVREFELARRSETFTVLDGIFNLYLWGYKTQSPAFSLVTYMTFNGRYKTSKVFCTNPALFRDLRELQGQKTFLIQQGFVQQSDLIFVHPELEVVAEIRKDDSSPHVAYTYQPKQPQAMPSMDSFPYRYANFGAGALEHINAWETANGGVFNADRSIVDQAGDTRNIYWFDVAKAPVFASIYNVSTADTPHTMSASFVLLTDRSLVYFVHKNSLFLTKEFKELMAREGFTYVGDTGPAHHFIHYDRGLNVMVSYVQLSDIDEPKVQLQISPM